MSEEPPESRWSDGIATYLSEMAPPGRRGFYLGFLQVTVVSGQLVALGLMLLLQHAFLTSAQLEAWGWRIPFLLGGLLAIFALYLRRGIDETEAFIFHRQEQPQQKPLARLLLHWRGAALARGGSPRT